MTARPAAAESKSEQERGASVYVWQALRAEVAGKNSDREGFLQAALEEAPDHPAARWQSGYVRSGKQWRKFNLLDDTITASSGHPFWIAGQGWVKARDIGPSAHFHGAAGTTPLERSEPAGVGRVYNLIVADFHSYFVGKAMVLSHDITRRSPSAMLVPGLARP
jgi:hypothetical protein